MEKLKPKISKKVKKVLSSVLAATLVLGSVPASTFLGEPHHYEIVRFRA